MKIRNVETHRYISLIRLENNKILKEHVSVIEGIKTVLDAGSRLSQEDETGVLYRDYFPLSEYYTLDNNKGESIGNHFNMDLHDLSSLNKKFDLVCCCSVLEHVRNPFIVAQQLESISDKYIFITAPFIFPYHPKKTGVVKDYWRFTGSGLVELFNNCEVVWVKRMGSVIRKVDDKKIRKKIYRKKEVHKGWTEGNSATGYAVLFKNKRWV